MDLTTTIATNFASLIPVTPALPSLKRSRGPAAARETVREQRIAS